MILPMILIIQALLFSDSLAWCSFTLNYTQLTILNTCAFILSVAVYFFLLVTVGSFV